MCLTLYLRFTCVSPESHFLTCSHICFTYVWTCFTYVSYIYICDLFSHMFDMFHICLADVWHMFDKIFTYVSHMFYICFTFVLHVSHVIIFATFFCAHMCVLWRCLMLCDMIWRNPSPQSCIEHCSWILINYCFVFGAVTMLSIILFWVGPWPVAVKNCWGLLTASCVAGVLRGPLIKWLCAPTWNK